MVRDDCPEIEAIQDEDLNQELVDLLQHEHVGLAVYKQALVTHMTVMHVSGDAGEHDPPSDFYA